MATSEYRDLLQDFSKSLIDTIEKDVNEIRRIVEDVELDSIVSLQGSMENIKTRLKELADKLY